MSTSTQSDPKRSSGRTGLMKILGSTKISPVLGLIALISIVYFKNNKIDTKKKKAVLRSNVDRTLPVFVTAEQMGKTRPNGPTLTRSFFQTGDVVIRKTASKSLQYGLVHKTKDAIWVHPAQASKGRLYAWLKQGSGRFALFRVRIPTVQQRLALIKAFTVHSHKNAFSTLYSLLRRNQAKLPASLSTQKELQSGLSSLVHSSHYNDFK